MIAVDDTYFPVIVTTWFGEPTAAAVREYYAWLRDAGARAEAEGKLLVNITDAGPAKAPAADVRRLIADQARDWKIAGTDMVKNYVVIESAVIRGVLTAISWLHGDMRATNVATCAQAIENGLRDLTRAGCPLPRGLASATWRRPERPRRSA